jgi:hypothetical protein
MSPLNAGVARSVLLYNNSKLKSYTTQPIPPSDLYLEFNGTEGSITFVDSSPNNLPVTAQTGGGSTPFITTETLYNGQSTGRFLGGLGGWLSIPSTIIDLAANDFEISVLVYPTSTVGVQTIVGIWPGATNASWRLLLVGEAVHFGFSTVGEVSADGNGKTCATGNVITASTWNLIKITRTGTQFKAEVNGSQEGTFTSSETIKPPSSDINVGRNEQLNTWYFVGNMKNLLINIP